MTNDYRSNVTFGHGATVGGVQSGGRGNVQINYQTINQNLRQQVLAKVDQILKDLDEAAPDDSNARADVEAISAEAENPNMTQHGLRDKIVAAIATAGVSEAVRQGLAHLLKTVM